MNRPSRQWINGSALTAAILLLASVMVLCSRSGRTDGRDSGPRVTVIETSQPADTSRTDTTSDTRHPRKKSTRKPAASPKTYPERSPLDERL